MKLATWNINGIKARHERLMAWLASREPDVVCLQEIKTEDKGFPVDAYKAVGYHTELWGQKAYNGVAILSRKPLTDVTRGFDDGHEDAQARFLTGVVDGVRIGSVYTPNGESVGSDKYVYKLAWLARFEKWVHENVGENLAALCGDYNVAPADIDVHDPVEWEGSVLVSPQEREALVRAMSDRLVDVFRLLQPDTVAYTWWDYRMLGFQKNKGLRIDHVLASKSLAKKAKEMSVDREARKGEKPSDHAPVMVTLDV